LVATFVHRAPPPTNTTTTSFAQTLATTTESAAKKMGGGGASYAASRRRKAEALAAEAKKVARSRSTARTSTASATALSNITNFSTKQKARAAKPTSPAKPTKRTLSSPEKAATGRQHRNRVEHDGTDGATEGALVAVTVKKKKPKKKGSTKVVCVPKVVHLPLPADGGQYTSLEAVKLLAQVDKPGDTITAMVKKKWVPVSATRLYAIRSAYLKGKSPGYVQYSGRHPPNPLLILTHPSSLILTHPSKAHQRTTPNKPNSSRAQVVGRFGRPSHRIGGRNGQYGGQARDVRDHRSSGG